MSEVERSASDVETVVTEATPLVEAESSPQRISTGTQLRAAREARALSVADVARVIRFSPRQIEALEKDDYASLPGATAVRGFVRSYAKLLKLDPAPLLEALDFVVPSAGADVRPPTNMGEAEQPTLAERVSPRVVASAAGMLIVLLLAFWYLTRPAGDAPPAATDVPLAVAPVAAPVAATPVAAPTPAVVPAEPAPAANPVPAPAPAVVPVPATTVAAAPTPAPAVAPAAANALQVEIDGRSWIEVRDATQKVIFVGEYPAGTRQLVSGKPPYQLWIGKASAVRLSYGERKVDLRPYTREEVARLTLE